MPIKRKKNVKIVLTSFIILGYLFSLTGFIGLLTINSVMWNNETIRFRDSNNFTIYNKYYPGKRLKGAMIFHGFGEDQNTMRGISNELIRNDFHVFATDFSGHGRSTGVLDSQNTTNNDTLVEQVLEAKNLFKQLSGLEDDQIILIGHSMGARAILQASTIDTNNVSSIILIGGAVFIPENETDTWVDELGPTNPASNIQIITGTWEDVLPPEEAIKVFNKLSNSSELLSDNQLCYKTTTSEDYNVELVIIPRLLHSYEPISPKVSANVLKFSLWEGETPTSSISKSINYYRLVFLLFLLSGLFLAVICALGLLPPMQKEKVDLYKKKKVRITNSKKYLLFKPLIWFGAYIIGIAFTALFFLLPVGKPFFTFIYLIPFSGSGIVMLTLHLLSKQPGMEGKWKPKKEILTIPKTTEVIILGILFIFTTFLSSFLVNSSLYHIFPLNFRLLWLFIFSILAFPGFFFILTDSIEIRRSQKDAFQKIFLNYLILFIPFLIMVLFIGVSGTLIYLPDGLHSLLVILFVLLFGEVTNIVFIKPLYISLMQSFLLFFLLTPRGPMLLNAIF
ncbi:MAG: alpha/beta fold hydrolase [Asgard group archaeon]|nr:alpha/beta fold hydrolase [Asgard group archaeon]